MPPASTAAGATSAESAAGKGSASTTAGARGARSAADAGSARTAASASNAKGLDLPRLFHDFVSLILGRRFGWALVLTTTSLDDESSDH